MGSFWSSSFTIPKVIVRADLARYQNLVVIRCDGLPEKVIKNEEDASLYGQFFAKLAHSLDEAPVGSALACDNSRFRSMAVCIVFLMWRGGYKTTESAQAAVRKQRGLGDSNCLTLYKPAIVLAVAILDQNLEV